MGLDLLPEEILQRYHVEERRHACAILATDCAAELEDIVHCLREFELLRSEIEIAGGRKSRIAERFDKPLFDRGWRERSKQVERTIDKVMLESSTHKVDFCKDRVAVEVEWNNKDPFFSRDLNAFRLLHELGELSVGVLITRMDDLQEIFDSLPPVWDEKWKRWTTIGEKYGPSTTHWSKLLPRIRAGEGGNCPLLLFGISKNCYRDDLTTERRAERALDTLKAQGIAPEGAKAIVEKLKKKERP